MSLERRYRNEPFQVRLNKELDEDQGLKPDPLVLLIPTEEKVFGLWLAFFHVLIMDSCFA